MNAPDQSPPATLHCDGPVAVLTLNAPSRHNALNLAAIECIEDAIAQVSDMPGLRVLLLAAATGPTFCAGAALDELASGHLSPSRFHDLLDTVAACPLPTVAAVSGNVHGGGAELPLSCDFRIGVRDMSLSVPATRIGLCYPPRGIRRYTTLLGASAAKRILLAGETFAAEDLEKLGYFDQVVGADDFPDALSSLTTSLARLAPLSVRATKELIDLTAANTWDNAVADAWVERCAHSEDLQRGLTAVRSKTTATFSGD